MKYAGIYLRDGKIFVHSVHKMITGAHLGQDDAVALDSIDYEGVGRAVRIALSAYREGAPVPRWDLIVGDRTPSLSTAAGVSSMKEFVKGAKSASVCWKLSEIIIAPWKNEGVRGGFSPLVGHDQIIAETASDLELGIAVVRALETAK